MENAIEMDTDADTAAVVEIVEEKTITLRKPVTFAKTEYTTLDLREPTAGELSKASKHVGNVDAAIALISLIAKVPRGAVEGLCQRDLQEASDFLGTFTLPGLPTGETS